MKDGINEMTNADKIRSMLDEELEKFIKHIKETCLIDALYSVKGDCDGITCSECRKKHQSLHEWLKIKC
mgnify:CR=1 FL=1